MNYCRNYENCDVNDNRGFSLVELIICVAILAIATIPLMKLFSQSNTANMKAQSLQNATSLAESVMEEVKALSITELKTKYDAKADYSFTDTSSTSGSQKIPGYTLKRSNVTATQGEKFNVEVTIATSTYMDSSADKVSFQTGAGVTNENVLAANNVKLPVLMEYDTSSSAYKSLDLSAQMTLSQADFTKFDSAAVNYFENCEAVHRTVPITSIDSKTIVIDKGTSTVAGNTNIDVKCVITYEYSGDMYSRELYSGTYSKVDPNKVDTNIYLFYKKTVPNETIVINDCTGNTGTHDVYFIRQDGVAGMAGTSITINHKDAAGTGDVETPIVYSSTSTEALDGDGDIERLDSTSGKHEKKNIALYTNLGDSGKFYKTDSNIRLYDVTVKVFRPGETEPCAKLTSTKEVLEHL